MTRTQRDLLLDILTGRRDLNSLSDADRQRLAAAVARIQPHRDSALSRGRQNW